MVSETEQPNWFIPLSIEAGSVDLDYCEDGHTDGYKDFTVEFSKAFRKIPHVTVAISAFDIEKSRNARLKVIAEDISLGGFKLRFIIWDDTKIYSAKANWIAISYDY